MLESATVVAAGALTAATPIPLMDWERYTQLLAGDILREQSPRQLLACRARVYELLVNCVPADTIMKRLSGFLIGSASAGDGGGGGAVASAAAAGSLRALPEAVRAEIVHWAAYYEHRLQLGSKELFHIEAFIARVMAVIKTPPAPPPPAAAAFAGGGGAGRA